MKYSIGENFDFNFEFISNINKKALINFFENAISAIIIVTNPAGWFLIAMEIFNIACKIYKIIRENFDNDYRAGKQREITNQQIAKIKVLIKKDIEEKLSEIYQNLDDTIKEIKDSLLDENKKIDKIINTFKNAKNEFYELSLSIKNKITRGENYGDTKAI